MKKLVFISLFTLTSGAHAAGLEYDKDGAICDRKSGFCADNMGVSVALTSWTKCYDKKVDAKATKTLLGQ